MGTPYPTADIVLFTRRNLEAISQRMAAHITIRRMDPQEAWRRAIEDEAQLIQYKLELMNEGIIKWDWPSEQLEAMRLGLRFVEAVEHIDPQPEPT